MKRLFAILAIALAGCATSRNPPDAAQAIREEAHPITGAADDYDALIIATGDARLILLGEATHGTSEFYRERDRITRRLILEKRLLALGLEADWSDAARVDAYVRGHGDDRSAIEALSGFDRFPRWMWRNREFVKTVEWLREHNLALPENERVRVFGVDLYGAEESVDEVLVQLRSADAGLAERAAELYGCFDSYNGDLESYGRAAAIQPVRSCQDEAESVLLEASARLEAAVDPQEREHLFQAVENARVVRDAEAYHRLAAAGGASTWNLRDRHMVDAMRAVQQHLIRSVGRDGMVVWAHNSHVGDARATSRADAGELNMGQLLRENTQPGASFIVGFSTSTGSVRAASNWGEDPREMKLRRPIRGSHSAILGESTIPAYYLILSELESEWVTQERPQRAVGVIYRPLTEYQSHYFSAALAAQFDAIIHIDDTTAVSPLD